MPTAASDGAIDPKACEIEAHRRAIKIHEDAVILFDRLYQTGKSAEARQRAERAHETLRRALEEQEEAERTAIVLDTRGW